jgi:hypothetical protein
MKPQQTSAVLRRLSPRTSPNRNQHISSFTEIVNAELDRSWTKSQIGTVVDIGRRQVNRALRVIADDNRREQPGMPPLLTPEQEQIIFHHITEAYGRNSAAKCSSYLTAQDMLTQRKIQHVICFRTQVSCRQRRYA